jgi:hypothetical protein
LAKKQNETESATPEAPLLVDEEEVVTEVSFKSEEASTTEESKVVTKEDEVELSTESAASPEESQADSEDPESSSKSSSAILDGQKLRPKFEVPKSLQGRLLEQAVVEKKAKIPANEKPLTPATVESKLKAPLRHRQNSRFSAPAATTSPPVVIKSAATRSRTRVRPDKPADLSASPSQTVARTRPSSPSRTRPSEAAPETTTTASPRGPTTTEKLTVADVLATLHGEPEPETKTSTLRPHAFKPKHGTASRDKLREKIREHLTVEDHAAAVAAGDVFDDEAQQLPARKETEEKAAHKPSAPEVSLSRGPSQSRRVPRPRTNPQPLEEERPRSSSGGAQPVITAPRRRQRPPQQAGAKVRQETEKVTTAPPPPTGGRLLSDADLMTGLGFGKKDSEPEFVPTAAPDLNEDLEEVADLDEQVLTDDKEEASSEGPYVPTIEDILKSAIVETNVPIAQEVLEASSTLPPLEPESAVTVSLPGPQAPRKAEAEAVPTRSRAHIVSRHRLDSSTHAPAPSRQTAPIESRRVRTRQRVVASTTLAPEVHAEDDNVSQPEAGQIQNSRQVSRVRQPIRSRVPSGVPGPAVKHRVQNVSSGASAGRVNNNKLKVRGGSRSTTSTTTTTTTASEDTEAITDDDFVLTESSGTIEPEDVFVPDYDIENVLGKLESDDDTENTNTDDQVDPDSFEDEEEDSDLNQVSARLNKDVESEEKVRRGKFQPRFGEKQRDSVRSKLKNQLFEPTPTSTEIPDESTSFQSVSPSEGLSSVPATFFTTTSRFESFGGSTHDAFLPTQQPQARIGRSTLGYTNNLIEVTEKPFSKLGISEHSVREELRVTTEVTRDATTAAAEVTSDVLTTTTEASEDLTTVAESIPADANVTETDDDNLIKPVEVGSRLFQRKKGDFLSKLAAKINSDREEKEKKLLNSFAESHSRITTKLPADEETRSTRGPEETSTKKSPFLSSIVRPRRKFELGQIGKDATEASSTETSPSSEPSVTSTPSPSKSSPKEAEPTLLPTPRPLPKDLKIPFSKKGFKPTLLAFTIEKQKPEDQLGGQEFSSTVAETTTSLATTSLDEEPPSQEGDSSSKLTSLKRKFQFGRKTFGKLVGQKIVEQKVVELSSSPPASTTPSTSSSSSEPNTPAPEVLTTPELSSKVF